MNDLADLHIHTNYSDSTSSPAEVVEKAHQEGLRCIAVTDHDTVSGIEPAIKCAQVYGIEILPGIELSSENNGKDIHILGYCVDHTLPYLLKQLSAMQETRAERMVKMVRKLNELGFKNISFEDVIELAGNTSLGRLHLAMTMVKKDIVKNIYEAFDKYLGEGAPVYVDKYYQTPADAIDLIRKSGGIAVLAHPMATMVDELIPSMVKNGLQGLEVYYHSASKTVIKFYENLAKKYGLVATGGSDAHGKAKEYTDIGTVKIPYSIVEKMKEIAKNAKSN